MRLTRSAEDVPLDEEAPCVVAFSRRLAARLERGPGDAPAGAWERAVADYWPAARTLALPDVPVVGVRGATLGGSGKTPVAIAIATQLAASLRVAFVGHGYRSLAGIAGVARHVQRDDPVSRVGDEALIARRALDGSIDVVVGGRRREALELAARNADVIVVDGLAQCRPRPLACSVLAVDHEAPWGSGRVVPFGDLVAPREVLSASVDVTVAVGGAGAESILSSVEGGTEHALEVLAGRRVGLVTTLARPDRVKRALRAAGVNAIVHVARGDHAPARDVDRVTLGRLARRYQIDVWLLDPKSAVYFDGDLGAPIARLLHRVQIGPETMARIRACVLGARGLAPAAQ